MNILIIRLLDIFTKRVYCLKQRPNFIAMRTINYNRVPVIKRESTRHDLEQKMNRVFNFIDQNLHSNIDLRDLANAACISEFHFIRVFTSFCGCTPYQYIIKKRIDKAKVMIRYNMLSVCEISRACGYGRVQSFRKCFKRETGFTPREFCRSHLAIA
jgi:AraC family transcriptional regulator